MNKGIYFQKIKHDLTLIHVHANEHYNFFFIFFSNQMATNVTNNFLKETSPFIH